MPRQRKAPGPLAGRARGSDETDSMSIHESANSSNPPGPCFACGGRRYWRRDDGAWLCATCHPPLPGSNPSQALVAPEPWDAELADPQPVEAPGQELPMLSAALAYARRGWPVFPCRPKGKEPLSEHGFKDAATNPATIKAWWSKWPSANIGIPTGAATFVALDVDLRHGGDETLHALDKEHGPLPPTAHVLTGGGGDHFYFRHPGKP
ncbi:MAG: bifunctional DNA primase/polymerase, partial [Anaerolineae bacterium]